MFSVSVMPSLNKHDKWLDGKASGWLHRRQGKVVRVYAMNP